jgi:hypothetical protein
MSSRDWALTVFVACVIAVIPIAFGNYALAAFLFLGVLALGSAAFDLRLKRHLPGRWIKPKPDHYNVHFMGQALALYDELVARGWVGSVERHRFEYPTNQLGVEFVARTLQTIGEG